MHKNPQRRARTSQAPPAKPVMLGRSQPLPMQKQAKALRLEIDPALRREVNEIVSTLRQLRRQGEELAAGRQMLQREVVAQVLTAARRVARNPDLLVTYRALSEAQHMSKPKDASDVFRIFLQDAYETKKMASWAFKETEILFESDISSEEAGRLIRENGIEKAAVVAGLKPEKALSRAAVVNTVPTNRLPPVKIAPNGKPAPQRPTPERIVPQGKPMQSRPLGGAPEGEPTLPMQMPKTLAIKPADIAHGDEPRAVCQLSGDEAVTEGDVIEVRVRRVTETGSRREVEGTWNVSY